MSSLLHFTSLHSENVSIRAGAVARRCGNGRVTNGLQFLPETIYIGCHKSRAKLHCVLSSTGILWHTFSPFYDDISQNHFGHLTCTNVDLWMAELWLKILHINCWHILKWHTAFLRQIWTFGQLIRLGPAATVGQKVREWCEGPV